MQYNARIGYDTRKDVDDTLLDALADYHPATGRTSRGHVEATITVPAESLKQATTTILAIAAGACTAPILSIEVMPTTEFDARHGLEPMPELVSITEAASALGVSRQAVMKRLKSGSLAGQQVGSAWVVQAAQVQAEVARRG